MLNETLDDSKKESNALLLKVFSDKEAAEKAYNSILSRGYTKDDINVLMSNETRDKYFANNELSDLPKTELEDKALEGMGIGGAIGTAIGGVAAAIAAIGTVLTIPGLGLVIAGPIAVGLAGAGAGGIAGGLAGVLVGSGISTDQSKEYEEAVKNGSIVIGIKTKSTDDYTNLDHALENLDENA